MIKMVVTDVDGTILNGEFGFSPAVKNCVKGLCKRGIKVVLVTGRMHCAATCLAKELGIDTPIVSYQGGMVKDSCENGKVYYKKYLSSEYALKIIQWARANDIHLNLYLDDVLYVEQDNETIRRYTKARYIDYQVCSFDDLKLENINKILAIDYSDPEKVSGWVEALKIEYPELYIVTSTPYFCEISHPDAKKSTAVEYLCKLWQISKDEVLAIGDQNNDIELLKAGGVKVAMGNATDELKTYADYVTDTVDNDGFVKAIEKFC